MATLWQLPKYTASVAQPLNLLVLSTSSVWSPESWLRQEDVSVLGYFCAHYSTMTSPTIKVLRVFELLFQTVT